MTDGLTFSTASAYGIHFARCDYCTTGQCPGGDHPWANADDIAHAVSIGRRRRRRAAEGRPMIHANGWDDDDA